MTEYLSVAEQLQILFEEVFHPENRPYTLQEVSQQIDVSLPTLSQLRSGRSKNPQLNTLRELCRFFKVPLRYFETHSREECYAVLTEKDAGVSSALNEISFRATHLSTQAQQDILKVIQWVQAAEQLRKQGVDVPPLPGFDNQGNKEDDIK
ncbi:MAG: helix-turn-helix transcriptional regulator [Anaerolineae bacterium]|nr:helix-turn-helix transcriptional regulator [Anaerolineae bacterium]